jgi:LysR family glycine cleavage system transcriptional activator
MAALPPLRSLEAFRAVIRHGGFAAAAESLSLTPSAVSHRIRDLEAHLGVALFERRNRMAAPTAAALRYDEALSQGFERIAAATRAIAEARGAEVLSLHCSPTFAAQWLMPRLKDFITAHPDLDVRLASTPDAASLQDGVFDVDIQYARPVPPGCDSIALATELVVPLCAPDIAATIGAPADLRRHQLLHSVRNLVQWDRWFDEQGQPAALPARGMHFDRSFLAIAAACDGLGVCLESVLMAERELASGRLVTPFGGVGLRVIGHRLIWRAQAGEQRKIRAFRAWITDALARSRAASAGE